MTVTASVETYLSVDSGVILVDETPCSDSPTTSQVDNINVLGGDAEEVVIIDYSFGLFAPGKTSEAAGTSEIEFMVNLGEGFDILSVASTETDDDVSVGTVGINVNADDDADISFQSLEQLEAFLLGGDDVISGQGSAATGGPLDETGPVFAIVGGEGNDVMQGGFAPFTAVAFVSSSSGVRVDLATGDAQGDGSDTFTNVDLAAGSFYADQILGNDSNNVIYGFAGADEISGLAGQDFISGMAGPDLLTPGPDDDEIEGNEGTDRVNYSGAGDSVTVNLDRGTSFGQGDDLISSVENVVGSRYGDELIGNGGRNVLEGLKGRDRLVGNGGADLLVGGPDANVLLGGDGDDRLRGGSVADRLEGGSGADSLGAAAGIDKLFGGGGRDVLYGSAGNDVLDGGPDADKLYGQDGNDKLNGSGGNDLVSGNAGGDTLAGGAGSDKLLGGAGDDKLNGGPGNDTLSGADGTDTCFQNDGSGKMVSCELPASTPKPPPPPPPPNCHPSYPDFCIPPPPPDLDCDEVGGSNFSVVGSDPHGFDGDNDGVGCES